MATPPTSASSPDLQSPSSEPGPSNLDPSTSNKRPASASLSDSETLVAMRSTRTSHATSHDRKANRAVLDAHRRRRKRKKLPVTQNTPQVSRIFRTKSPGSPKGKEREIELKCTCDQGVSETPAEGSDNELALLRRKVEEQTTLLDAHKEFLASLAPSITCQICLDPMQRPYTLVPCGHTACYDCLLAWFRAPPVHITLPPPAHLVFNFDAEEPSLLARHSPMLLRKEKTCPHCRAIVRDTPVEAWGVKDIVSHLFSHKGGAAGELFPSCTRPEGVRQSEVSLSGPDAWKGVFRPDRAARMRSIPNPNANREDGVEHEDGSEHGHQRPFYDEEDAVYRCMECYHEIWDGVCSSCGRFYPSHHDEFGDEDEEDDGGNWMDAEDFDADHLGIEDAHGGPGGDIAIRGIMGALGFHRHLRPIREDDDGEDEDSYESSFIDDDDNQTRMEEYHSAEDAGEDDSDDEEMGSVVEMGEEELPRRVPPPRIDGSDEETVSLVQVGTIDLAESDSDDAPVPASNNRGRTRVSVTRIDSDDDDTDTDTDSPRAGRVPAVSRSRRRPIVDDSDSEQEEVERSDHGGVDRHYRPYAESMSDEESLSDDGSDRSSQHESLRGSVSDVSYENYGNYVFSDDDEVMWYN